MRGVSRRIAPGDGDIPALLSGVGLVLLLAFIGETLYFSGGRLDVVLSGAVAVGVLTAVPFTVALVYGGYWLHRSDLDEARYRRAGLWCLAGTGVFLALNLAVAAVWTPLTTWALVGWMRGATGIGAAFGLLIGISEARAIQSAIAAERSNIRADQLDSRREWLDYLNGLLRHEVLNNSQVISGYSSILLNDHDLEDGVADRLQTIRRQSEDMTRVTEDIRVLIEATRGADERGPIAVRDVLVEELADIRETHPSVDVEADLPEDLYVRADELVRRVFSNLLTNAVEHNDRDTPRVTVGVDATPETVRVRIADNGPGVPPSVRESLGETSDRRVAEHGLGLHLVGRLLDRYDGAIDLVETGADGSVFTVELPRATPAVDRAVDRPVGDPAERPETTSVTRPRTDRAGRGNPAE